MCGICGFVGPGTSSDLSRMTESLAHRGPDGSGVWTSKSDPVFLGHRRLSIVDLSTGDQPMTADDLVVVFNGEIYNHRELRKELESLGHRFRSDHSDTEVLLHGFRAWGDNLPLKLNGMWAFVIYDTGKQKLFASRDRFGKKPFYYTTCHGGFAFGSELIALQAHADIAPRLRISAKAVQKYFGYGYIPAPHSIWEGVWKLPAGHSLWLSIETPNVPHIAAYWRFVLEPVPITSAADERSRTEEITAALEGAVARRLLADVSIGIFLSGGIDSSLVTALAARHSSREPIRTFCIGFEEASFDETDFARLVSSRYRTEHFEERLSIDHARSFLPDLIERLDEPLGDSSLLPTALLCEFAHRRVKVALGGDGGDELFGGYDPFRALRAAELYSKLVPRPVHQGIAALTARWPVSHRNMSFDFKLKRFVRGAVKPRSQWLPTWMAPLLGPEIQDFLNVPVKPEELFSEAIAAWDGCSQSNVVDQTLQFYTQIYLQEDILVKTDRASMMWGLEVRAPFLDIDVVDLARKLPSAWKFRKGTSKYILKQVAAPLLPSEIVNRPKKGFGMPIGHWFQRGIMGIEKGHTNDTFVQRMQAEHRRGTHDHRGFLWNEWVLERWLRSRCK